MAEFLELEAQDGVRMPWNVIPGTKQEFANCVIPISAIYTPLKPLSSDHTVLPYPPLRCRTCRSLLNPFSVVDFAAKIWNCPFCFTRNHFPSHYSSISEDNLPAELFPQYTTVEYEPPETHPSHSSPPVFLFVVDTSLIEEELGFLKSALSQAFDLLPDNALVGLVTFGTYVQVHEIGFPGGIPKSFVFKGSKEITKDQLMEKLSFFNKKPLGPTGVIAGVRDGLSSQTIARFLMRASDCEFVLNSLLEELQKDPWGLPADLRPARCTGTALSIAAHLLGACVPGHGARIMAFVGGPSTEGPGAIVSKSLSEPIRSHKDLDKDSVPHYHKAVKFYEGLSKQLVNQGHVLDLFACALDQDARMKSTSEVLRNIKTIKLQAWDNQFLRKLERLRSTEYNWIWKSLRLGAIGAFVFWGSPTFISLVTFGSCLLIGIPLTAGRVLSALATFRMLQDPIFSLPDLLNVVAQAKVSADRVSSYLQEEEIQKHSVEFIPKNETPYAIEVDNGKFSWDPLSRTPPTLDMVNLRVLRGMKVAVCGSVGSGKSSLLSALIGEIHRVCGGVKISGSKAYVPQTPWILTGNVRENILFGGEFDAEKYRKTVKSCALEKDFELFSCGDLTEIGERGINMSGGQKQRIQIARAVYQDADIYLLDDPFSAVDAHTGTQLFQECLMGMLKDKTIVYVTHQVEFLPAADLILVMKNGRVAQTGTFNELLSQNIGFEVLVGAHNEALESILVMEASSRPSQSTEFEQDLDQNAAHDDTQDQQEIIITGKEGKLIQDEEREKGSIDKQVYWSYLTTVKRGVLVPLIVLAQSSFQVLQIASNYWIAWACPTTTQDSAEPIKGMDHVLLIYMILSVFSSVCVLARAVLVATQGLLAAQKLFEDLLCSILRAPMSFFDSTPTGRILNRVSSDQSVLDLEIANRLGWAVFSTIQLIGTIAVMSQVAWEVFVIFIPVTAICIWYKQYYIPTARELARLAEIQKAPILHHFAESLAGAATIRAFDQKARFVDANLVLIDTHSRPWFHNVSAMEWLSFRLNQLSNFVFAFSLVLLVSLPDGIINPSIAGLAVTYGINLNVLQASVIWNICNAENKMISVERILQYSKLESEAPLIIQESRPSDYWPTLGSIHFQNLQIRYAEHLPAVLKNITCTFPGRKKIGVVGRTGSGKSTLIQALFRIVEPREGSIIIDNVDICKIGLHDLRSRLSIIPQDPTMFDGTVRGNLDPLQQHSDAEIWEALDKCQLRDVVHSKEGKLDTIVVENGENWSVGQRQLFCLGRVLLKQSSILVLDEATASVDSATDGVIQKIINQEFKDRTIVTIAHRIHTVIDSDLVLVLSEGRVAEYDTPKKLLEREDSFFSRLIREYSMRSQICSS